MKKRKIKKVPIIILMFLTVVLLIVNNTTKSKEKRRNRLDLKSYYNDYVRTNENVKIYDGKKNVVGKLSNVDLKLEKKIKNKYFKIDGIDAYIYYKDVKKIDKKNVNKTNYVPFNKMVVLKENTKLNISEDSFYSFDKEIKFSPIKIDNDRYYFIYNDDFVYVKSDDIKEQIDISDYKYTNAISVINYHYVISLEADEKKDCQQTLCLTDSQYDEQMKYLKDNGYYTATMEDLDLWIDKKINLPEKTVVITIDDGWFVSRNIQILEKYNLHATLFLIGSLASPDAYKSDNLEIHSHTWNMHNLGECPIKRGGAILCKDKEYVVADLKKSSESLNNSKYFAYPFYEYNDHAIECLKEAGFRMALAGGARKVTQGIDKYSVPRFGISNTDSLDTFIRYIS